MEGPSPCVVLKILVILILYNFNLNDVFKFIKQLEYDMEELALKVSGIVLQPDKLGSSIQYRTVKYFGGGKTLANLANHNNSPTFFANFQLHMQ